MRARKPAVPRGVELLSGAVRSSPRGRRPGRTLELLRHRSQALIGELLDALSFVGLGRIDVAPRIGRDVVHAVPLTRLPAALAERRQDVERIPPQDMNERVLAVSDV